GTFALHLILERGRGGLGTLFRILRGAAEEMLAVLVIAAAAGLLIGALNFTGLGFRMTLWLSFIAETAGLLPMLITTAVLCVLLGMGMPTAAVYILLSAILGPSLIHVGVDALAAHMFIFYFGLLSMLTPPVAIASYTAAGLAGAKLGETSLIALRFAAVAFLLPFLFVYEPALIGREGAARLLMVGVPVLIASIALAWSLVGSMGGRVFRRPVFRPICAVAAVAVSVVALFNTTIGFAGAALLIFAVYSLSAGQKASCVGQGLSGRP
ncbi:MAG: TRAP transporter large permease subunit, partial [Rhodobacteraceae bacterium]|nr:TRAP transporter large permease subunit [Paracoccaceae bacterium]